ncbi:hypothetical protein M9Y10_017670 [Tritrichomonas musculus]|uniref:Uncharacterized protein n=1 Tax=Tritrichomonas musculus TaxID=1915356 RepID=A0ABR2HU61_9EUKA
MELTIPKVLLQVFHIFTICCLALDFVTDCYFLSGKEFSWTIHTGVNPKYRYYNMGFLFNMAALVYLLLAVFLIVVEVLALLEIKIFEVFERGIVKPIVIICVGLGHLGMCGDLGLASGILTLFAGVIWLILAVLLMI